MPFLGYLVYIMALRIWKGWTEYNLISQNVLKYKVLSRFEIIVEINFPLKVYGTSLAYLFLYPCSCFQENLEVKYQSLTCFVF